MKIRKKISFLLAALVLSLSLTGCVDQSGETSVKDTENLKIVATSVATVEIMEKLDIDLVGVPNSDLYETPERYKDTEHIGYPMSPDMEIIKSLSPDWILSPSSLEADLKPKYEAAKINAAFLNLKSVPGMYQSIKELGEMFGREKQAQELIDKFETFYAEYKEKNKDKAKPRVLVLMGLPGSYIVATENSYVGSLVKMAGGINVYEEETEEFIAANTEDMATRNPDIILRTAHALPDQVMEMFAEEFETNDIWKHFKAVQEGKVYDLNYDLFGMSAKFNYPEALEELQPLLYGEENE